MSGPGRKGLMEEVGRGVGSGLVGLHRNGTLTLELFTVSRNWLALDGTAPLVSLRSQRSQNQNENTPSSPTQMLMWLPGVNMLTPFFRSRNGSSEIPSP